MRKIQDRFLGGMVVGLGANIVKVAIDQTLYRIGFSRTTGFQKAAGFFLKPEDINTPMGKLIGGGADSTVAAFMGVLAVNVMSLVGKNHFLLKGFALGHATWSFAYGILARFGFTSIKEEDPNTVMAQWISHSVFGFTKGILINKLIEPSLFRPHYASLGMPESSAEPGRERR